MARHRAGSRIYRSASRAVVQVARQQQRAVAQAARQQQQAYLQSLETQATTFSHEAERRFETVNELLPRGLSAGKRFEWGELKTNSAYPPFSYSTPAPSYPSVAATLHVPRKFSLLELLFPGRRTKREDMEANAHKELATQLAAFESSKDNARRAYERRDCLLSNSKIKRTLLLMTPKGDMSKAKQML